MPYGRRRLRYKKRSYKKRIYRRPKRTFKKRVFRKAVKKIVDSRIETKNIDNGLLFTIQNTWTVSDVIPTWPVNSTAASGRLGDQITPMSLSGRYYLYNGGDTPGNTVRIVIVRWKQTNSSDPITNAKIFATTSGTNAVNSTYLTADQGRHKFDVLYDKTFSLGSTKNIVGRFSIKLKKKLNFATTSGGPITGNLHWLVCSDSGGVTDPVYTAFHRLTYKDA